MFYLNGYDKYLKWIKRAVVLNLILVFSIISFPVFEHIYLDYTKEEITDTQKKEAIAIGEEVFELVIQESQTYESYFNEMDDQGVEDEGNINFFVKYSELNEKKARSVRNQLLLIDGNETDYHNLISSSRNYVSSIGEFYSEVGFYLEDEIIVGELINAYGMEIDDFDKWDFTEKMNDYLIMYLSEEEVSDLFDKFLWEFNEE
jgi:hypothetical protein